MAELGETPLLVALLSLSSSPAVHSNVALVTIAGHTAPPAASLAIAIAEAGRQPPLPTDRSQRPWSGRGWLWLGEGQAWVRPGQPCPGWPPLPADAPLLADPTPLPLPCVLREVEEEGVNLK